MQLHPHSPRFIRGDHITKSLSEWVCNIADGGPYLSFGYFAPSDVNVRPLTDLCDLVLAKTAAGPDARFPVPRAVSLKYGNLVFSRALHGPSYTRMTNGIRQES